MKIIKNIKKDFIEYNRNNRILVLFPSLFNKWNLRRLGVKYWNKEKYRRILEKRWVVLDEINCPEKKDIVCFDMKLREFIKETDTIAKERWNELINNGISFNNFKVSVYLLDYPEDLENCMNSKNGYGKVELSSLSYQDRYNSLSSEYLFDFDCSLSSKYPIDFKSCCGTHTFWELGHIPLCDLIRFKSFGYKIEIKL